MSIFSEGEVHFCGMVCSVLHHVRRQLMPMQSTSTSTEEVGWVQECKLFTRLGVCQTVLSRYVRDIVIILGKYESNVVISRITQPIRMRELFLWVAIDDVRSVAHRFKRIIVENDYLKLIPHVSHFDVLVITLPFRSAAYAHRSPIRTEENTKEPI